MAFAFEKVLHSQKIFVRPLTGKISSKQEFIGTAILSTGEPTFVLNLKQIMEDYNEKRNAA